MFDQNMRSILTPHTLRIAPQTNIIIALIARLTTPVRIRRHHLITTPSTLPILVIPTLFCMDIYTREFKTDVTIIVG
jgi:hypothetical protein